MRIHPLVLSAAILSFPQAQAQTAPVAKATPIAASAPSAVPTLVPYAGVAEAPDGKPLTGETSFTFLLFKDEQGGEPLWTESQMVTVDGAGHYQVQLGAGNPSGISPSNFASGEGRWLEIQIAGQPTQPRVLLMSVPYAMKAADAATLGGLPASAYALAGPAAAAASTASAAPDATSSTVTTPGGTAGYLPLFSGATTIDDSLLFQSGSNLGINTTTPAATLDVRGTIAAHGLVTLDSAGVATATAAKDSQALEFQASAYNSTIKSAAYPQFTLQAEPSGNNTGAPGATLNLLYGNGMAAAETGFHFNPNGTIAFAPGQTFPGSSTTGTGLLGTSSSGTGVEGTSTSATGVAGSSTTGNGMLGYTAGGTLNTAGVLGGAGGPSGFGGIAGVWGDASAHVGVLGTSYLYAGVEGISQFGQGVQGQSTTGFGVQGASSSGPGLSGTSNTSNGVVGSTGGTSLYTAGVLGSAGARTSFGGIAGVWGDAANHVGVFGSSNQYAGVAGASTSGSGVQGASTSATGVAGSSTTGNGMLGYTAGGTPRTAGVLGGAGGPSGFSGIAGVWGDSSAHVGVFGSSNQYAGVLGQSSTGDGVYGVSNDFNASDDVAGVYGYATGVLPAVKGHNIGANGPAAMFINDSSSVPAVIGISYGGGPNASAVAVYGDSAESSGIGVEGNTLSGIGVYATTRAQSTGFQLSDFVGPIALWADSTPPNGDGEGIAIRATANDNNAVSFTNNSEYSTVYAYNYGSGNTGTGGLFRTLEAASPDGVCGFGGKGDMACTGQVKSLATTGNGARTVETYSMQSPENWMEDFGSGTLQNGRATVSIDASFAETISDNADYHVFLTPRGDSKGLYVTNATPTSFEVHESGGGASTLGFDYRIVAKRRGFETQRMVDVTEAMKAMKALNSHRMERLTAQSQNRNSLPQPQK